MFKWLKSLIDKIGESKFWKFLKEVFAGKTGEFLDDNYEIINESVQATENISKYILENSTKTFDELKLDILDKFSIIITDEQISKIDKDKSLGKFKLAYELSVSSMKINGKDFFENAFKSALSLGIELAVNRFFGK